MAASLEVAQRTDPGLDPSKQENEDAGAHGLTPVGHLLVVCDGMGGHALGREASQLALSTISRILQSAPSTAAPGPILVRAIAEAGRAVYRLGGQGPSPSRPGSTCVAVLVHGASADVAHVGDSRAFLVRRGQAWQLTKDHSVVQEMLNRGLLTAEQAAAHPDANKITRALGMKPETEVELRDPPIPCVGEDVFALATDGLCDLVRADEIAAVVTRAATLEAACDELVRMAKARGGHDNITIQLARCPPTMAVGASGGTAPSPAVPFPESAVAPTIVEAAVSPDKTVVDPLPAHLAPATARLEPAAKPFIAPRPAEPVTHRGSPSRAGWLVLVLGFAGMALILAGVVLWWFFREPR